MAKFCENCGNPVDEGTVFCDNCGARLGTSVEQPTGVQYAVPSGQQESYGRQGQYPIPNTYPQPPKKNKAIWLLIGGVVVLLAVIVVLLILLRQKPQEDQPQPEEPQSIEQVEQPTQDIPEPTEPDMELVIEPEEVDLPDFERYGIAMTITQGEPFDVVTSVNDSDEYVIGKGRLEQFTRESVSQQIVDFLRENGEDVTGYDVLRVHFVVEFPESMVNRETMTFNGTFRAFLSDYYHIVAFEDSRELRTDSEGEKYQHYVVQVDGEELPVFAWPVRTANLENGILYYHNEYTILVPGGYDGLVCGYRDIRLSEEERIYEHYTPETYQILRLAGGDTPAQETAGNAVETLPYANLGAPADTDFAWVADAQSGILLGDFIGKDAFIGKWKAEIIFDGVFELMNITISEDGTVTIAPHQFNAGGDWMDQSSEGPYTLSGLFNVGGAGNIVAAGDYGNLDLYQFTEYDGTQYGMGKLTVPSGETGNVYLVRP